MYSFYLTNTNDCVSILKRKIKINSEEKKQKSLRSLDRK